MANEDPARTALRTSDEKLTYGELSREAAALAIKLAQRGVGRGSRILILPSRGISLVTTMLAAFRVGSAVSVVDPRHPDEYIAACVGVLEPELIVDLSDRSGPWAGRPVLREDDVRRTGSGCGHAPGPTAGQDLQPAEKAFQPDDCAIITFTSGTTGIPKAVAGRYSSLSYFYDWMDARFGPLHGARFGMCSSIGHDPIQRDIMTPLYLGGSIVVPQDDILDQPTELGQWLRDEHIEAVCLNPVLITSLDHEGPGLPDLRLFLSVGAALTRGHALRLRRLAPDARILNLYGSTETHRAVGYFEVPRQPEEIAALPATIPLGEGMKDARLEVVSLRDTSPCVPFEIGEIAMRSSQIGLGYLNSPELTSERFRPGPPAPPDGSSSGASFTTPTYMTGDLGYYAPGMGVISVGRSDDQVKINGYRVELAEVNAACHAHPQVSEAVTIVRDIDGVPSLTTFLVPSDETLQFSVQGFRAFLARTLPHYAVPQHIITRDSVPLTINRKVDIDTLKREAEARHAGDGTDVITDFVRRHTGMDRPPQDTPLGSLGIDSLRFSSLVSGLIPDAAARGRYRLRNSMTIRQALTGEPPQAPVSVPLSVPRQRSAVTTGAVRHNEPVTRVSSTEITFGTRTLAHACSNDYLGLGTRTGDPEALEELFASGLPLHSHGSPAVNSHTAWHEQLAGLLCELYGTESSLLFSSAYLANTAVIPGVAGPGDHVLVDESSHASISDGCLLSGATIHVFRHNDVGHLASLVGNLEGSAGRKVIITEGVFSVEGDVADLPALSEVARAHDCLLMVDEASSLGQIGRSGHGVEEHFGLRSAVDLRVGSLAKALGSSGGYATGSRELVDAIRSVGGAVFSTGLSPVHAFMAHRSARELLDNGEALVSRLRSNAETWRSGLNDAGLSTGGSQAAIVPIMCGSAEEVDRRHSAMLDAGVYAIPIAYPWSRTVNAIRTSVTADHDSDDLMRLAAHVADVLLRAHEDSS
ncbi:aminotransferase class I/II-fold pyridoxal phosphate-dependent enzyme [Nocardiopsis gilva]|uniref:aminotransferase class I/II-fold pyridoxal phosphate-dependent enzyme n=1 Tax=Nocardiopsis gilva TaxID=280236 RepID=UPI0009FCC31F